MKYIFAAWATPLVLFWGWYFLSLNDMNFGYVMLSRAMHDVVFGIYGDMLGIDPAIIPGLVARACVIDTLLIGAIWAFRRRRELMAWGRRVRSRHGAASAAGEAPQPVQNPLENESGRRGIDAGRPLLARNVHLDKGPFGGYRRQPLVPEGEG